MTYQYLEPGETIFKPGDKGDRYYIVMKGRVQLTVPASASILGILS